jgi:thiol-disulfide isomerase/thioredoxin
MRCLLLLFLLLVAFSCSQQNEDRPLARIEGQISNLPVSVSSVKLKRMGLKGPETVDSVEIEEGKFTIEIPADSEFLYRLEFGEAFLPLFAEQGQHQLSADFRQLYLSARYSNSPHTDQMRKTEMLRLGFEAKAQELQNRFETALYTGRQKSADSARQAFEILRMESKRRIKFLIDSIGPGPVSYLATSMLDPEEDYLYLDSLTSRFEKERPGKAFTQKLQRFMELPRRLAIGKPAPDFSLANPAGKMTSVSGFKGSWVLLDFWASWCKPCRAENPFLTQVHQRYKGRGLKIFSVSLDGDREAWMKAMVQDQMDWAHASDLKGWQSSAAALYGINSIPASFLIDPEGKIAAKNLRGPALLQKLVEIFP